MRVQGIENGRDLADLAIERDDDTLVLNVNQIIGVFVVLPEASK